MEKITDWPQIASESKSTGKPVIVLIDQYDCPFCRRVEGEFFPAIFANAEFKGKALYGKISIDDGETIVGPEGSVMGTREFLGDVGEFFTPTILFYDDQQNELSEKIIGLSTPDFYGYYLEQGIKESIAKLNQ